MDSGFVLSARPGMTWRGSVTDKIVIIGGGIGGLAAALSLLKRGLDVEIHEQAPELKEVGAGIQISSNGTRVLYALGLENALKRVQVLPSGRVIRHWSTGETWNWFELGAVTRERYGTPHVMLHRGDLHGLLADAVRAAKPDAIKLNRRCAAIENSGDHAEVRFEDGATVRAAYVIGADGIHSKVRAGLFGADKPEFTGAVAWRGYEDWLETESPGDAPVVILETADPAKFPEEIERMMGWSPDVPPMMEIANKLPEDFDRMGADYEAFKAYLLDKHQKSTCQ